MNKKDLNKLLCQFIKEKFFSPFKINGLATTQNKYAKACNLTSSTISKINSPEGYDIPTFTLFKLCSFENIPMSDLFKKFEEYLSSKV